MFVFNRSALAVVLPLALLTCAVIWSNRTPTVASAAEARQAAQFAAAVQEMGSRD